MERVVDDRPGVLVPVPAPGLGLAPVPGLETGSSLGLAIGLLGVGLMGR